MPGLRSLLRFAPFVVGAVAASLWLRRRQAARLALTAPPAPRALEPPPDAPRAPTGRFERQIDIVTVVDDLLLAGR